MQEGGQGGRRGALDSPHLLLTRSERRPAVLLVRFSRDAARLSRVGSDALCFLLTFPVGAGGIINNNEASSEKTKTQLPVLRGLVLLQIALLSHELAAALPSSTVARVRGGAAGPLLFQGPAGLRWGRPALKS